MALSVGSQTVTRRGVARTSKQPELEVLREEVGRKVDPKRAQDMLHQEVKEMLYPSAERKHKNLYRNAAKRENDEGKWQRTMDPRVERMHKNCKQTPMLDPAKVRQTT